MLGALVYTRCGRMHSTQQVACVERWPTDNHNTQTQETHKLKRHRTCVWHIGTLEQVKVKAVRPTLQATRH